MAQGDVVEAGKAGRIDGAGTSDAEGPLRLAVGTAGDEGMGEEDVPRAGRRRDKKRFQGRMITGSFRMSAMGKHTRLPVFPRVCNRFHGQASTLAHGTQRSSKTASDPRRRDRLHEPPHGRFMAGDGVVPEALPHDRRLGVGQGMHPHDAVAVAERDRATSALGVPKT